MEILICGVEAFREAVPSEASFIDFVAAESVDVGKRNQLDPRGSVGIEARQLASAGGQSQRERLLTVTVEITTGEKVVGVEAVVNLGDEARQIVERGRND